MATKSEETEMNIRNGFDAGEQRTLEALSRHYLKASEDIAPPDAVRTRILAAAEESLQTQAPRRKTRFSAGWMGLFAAAFSAVLAVALIVDLGVDRSHEGLLSPASTEPAAPASAPAPDGLKATLPAPPVSKGGTCALQVPDIRAPRAMWEAEYARLAASGCSASQAELQKKFAESGGDTIGQKLTGMQK